MSDNLDFSGLNKPNLPISGGNPLDFSGLNKKKPEKPLDWGTRFMNSVHEHIDDIYDNSYGPKNPKGKASMHILADYALALPIGLPNLITHTTVLGKAVDNMVQPFFQAYKEGGASGAALEIPKQFAQFIIGIGKGAYGMAAEDDPVKWEEDTRRATSGIFMFWGGAGMARKLSLLGTPERMMIGAEAYDALSVAAKRDLTLLRAAGKKLKYASPEEANGAATLVGVAQKYPNLTKAILDSNISDQAREQLARGLIETNVKLGNIDLGKMLGNPFIKKPLVGVTSGAVAGFEAGFVEPISNDERTAYAVSYGLMAVPFGIGMELLGTGLGKAIGRNKIEMPEMIAKAAANASTLKQLHNIGLDGVNNAGNIVRTKSFTGALVLRALEDEPNGMHITTDDPASVLNSLPPELKSAVRPRGNGMFSIYVGRADLPAENFTSFEKYGFLPGQKAYVDLPGFSGVYDDWYIKAFKENNKVELANVRTAQTHEVNVSDLFHSDGMQILDIDLLRNKPTTELFDSQNAVPAVQAGDHYFTGKDWTEASNKSQVAAITEPTLGIDINKMPIEGYMKDGRFISADEIANRQRVLTSPFERLRTLEADYSALDRRLPNVPRTVEIPKDVAPWWTEWVVNRVAYKDPRTGEIVKDIGGIPPADYIFGVVTNKNRFIPIGERSPEQIAIEDFTTDPYGQALDELASTVDPELIQEKLPPGVMMPKEWQTIDNPQRISMMKEQQALGRELGDIRAKLRESETFIHVIDTENLKDGLWRKFDEMINPNTTIDAQDFHTEAEYREALARQERGPLSFNAAVNEVINHYHISPRWKASIVEFLGERLKQELDKPAFYTTEELAVEIAKTKLELGRAVDEYKRSVESGKYEEVEFATYGVLGKPTPLAESQMLHPELKKAVDELYAAQERGLPNLTETEKARLEEIDKLLTDYSINNIFEIPKSVSDVDFEALNLERAKLLNAEKEYLAERALNKKLDELSGKQKRYEQWSGDVSLPPNIARLKGRLNELTSEYEGRPYDLPEEPQGYDFTGKTDRELKRMRAETGSTPLVEAINDELRKRGVFIEDTPDDFPLEPLTPEQKRLSGNVSTEQAKRNDLLSQLDKLYDRLEEEGKAPETDPEFMKLAFKLLRADANISKAEKALRDSLTPKATLAFDQQIFRALKEAGVKPEDYDNALVQVDRKTGDAIVTKPDGSIVRVPLSKLVEKKLSVNHETSPALNDVNNRLSAINDKIAERLNQIGHRENYSDDPVYKKLNEQRLKLEQEYENTLKSETERFRREGILEEPKSDLAKLGEINEQLNEATGKARQDLIDKGMRAISDEDLAKVMLGWELKKENITQEMSDFARDELERRHPDWKTERLAREEYDDRIAKAKAERDEVNKRLQAHSDILFKRDLEHPDPNFDIDAWEVEQDKLRDEYAKADEHIRELEREARYAGKSIEALTEERRNLIDVRDAKIKDNAADTQMIEWYNKEISVVERKINELKDKDIESAKETRQKQFASLLDKSPEELNKIIKDAQKADHDLLVELFGSEEEARKYERLQRRANSTTGGTEAADKASDEVEAMEARLTREQQDRLFGIGEKGLTVEDYDAIAKAARAYSQAELEHYSVEQIEASIARLFRNQNPDRNFADAFAINQLVKALEKKFEELPGNVPYFQSHDLAYHIQSLLEERYGSDEWTQEVAPDKINDYLKLTAREPTPRESLADNLSQGVQDITDAQLPKYLNAVDVGDISFDIESIRNDIYQNYGREGTKLPMNMIALVVREIYNKAVKDLGPDLGGYSVRDLIKDQLPLSDKLVDEALQKAGISTERPKVKSTTQWEIQNKIDKLNDKLDKYVKRLTEQFYDENGRAPNDAEMKAFMEGDSKYNDILNQIHKLDEQMMDAWEEPAWSKELNDFLDTLPKDDPRRAKVNELMDLNTDFDLYERKIKEIDSRRKDARDIDPAISRYLQKQVEVSNKINDLRRELGLPVLQDKIDANIILKRELDRGSLEDAIDKLKEAKEDYTNLADHELGTSDPDVVEHYTEKAKDAYEKYKFIEDYVEKRKARLDKLEIGYDKETGTYDIDRGIDETTGLPIKYDEATGEEYIELSPEDAAKIRDAINRWEHKPTKPQPTSADEQFLMDRAQNLEDQLNKKISDVAEKLGRQPTLDELFEDPEYVRLTNEHAAALNEWRKFIQEDSQQAKFEADYLKKVPTIEELNQIRLDAIKAGDEAQIGRVTSELARRYKEFTLEQLRVNFDAIESEFAEKLRNGSIEHGSLESEAYMQMLDDLEEAIGDKIDRSDEKIPDASEGMLTHDQARAQNPRYDEIQQRMNILNSELSKLLDEQDKLEGFGPSDRLNEVNKRIDEVDGELGDLRREWMGLEEERTTTPLDRQRNDSFQRMSDAADLIEGGEASPEEMVKALEDYIQAAKDLEDTVKASDFESSGDLQGYYETNLEQIEEILAAHLDNLRRDGIPAESDPTAKALTELRKVIEDKWDKVSQEWIDQNRGGPEHADLEDEVADIDRDIEKIGKESSSLTVKEWNNYKKLADEYENYKPEMLRDIVAYGRSRGYYVDMDEPGKIVVRDAYTWRKIFKADTPEEIREFINKSGDAKGPDLDGGGNDNTVPPDKIVSGGLPPDGDSPNPFEADEFEIPEGKQLATIDDWINTHALVTPYKDYFQAIDHTNETRLYDLVFKKTQPHVLKVEAIKNLWYQKIKDLEKVAIKAGIKKDRFPIITRFIEALNTQDILDGALGRKLTQDEIDFANQLVALDPDFKHVFGFARKMYNLDRAFNRNFGVTSNKADLTNPKHAQGLKDYRNKVEDVISKFGMTNSDLQAYGTFLKIFPRNIREVKLGNVVELAMSIINKSPNRTEFAKLNKMTPAELEIAAKFDEMYRDLAPLFGIKFVRSGYMPHFRVSYEFDPEIDVSTRLGGLEGLQPYDKQGRFMAKLIRTGEINQYEMNPFKALARYVNGGFNATLNEPVIREARAAALKELNEKVRNEAVRQDIGNKISYYLDQGLRHKPTAQDIAIEAAWTKFVDRMGFTKGGFFRKYTGQNALGRVSIREVMNTWNILSSGSMLGFRPMQGMRDFSGLTERYYVRFGATRTLRMLSMPFERDEFGVPRYNKLKASGDTPGLGITEYLSREEEANALFAAGKVKRVATKLGKWGLDISIQDPAYTLGHAGAYLDTIDLATKTLNRYFDRKITSQQVIKTLSLNTYKPAYLQGFYERLKAAKGDKTKIPELARDLAQETGAEVIFTYGWGNSPYKWGTITGRLLSQFGYWAVNTRTMVLQAMSRGTRAEKMAALRRLAIAETSLFMTGRAAGINLRRWLLVPGMVFLGGPAPGIAQQMQELTGDRGQRRQELAQAEITSQIDMGIVPYAGLVIPGSYAMSDWIRALEYYNKNDPAHAVARGFGIPIGTDPLAEWTIKKLTPQ